MTHEQFDAARKRLCESWNGSVTLEKREVERVIAEIMWLKRRLLRVEHAIEPLIEAITRR
jgi:hypothetical protein